jgi:hypothetical protein
MVVSGFFQGERDFFRAYMQPKFDDVYNKNLELSRQLEFSSKILPRFKNIQKEVLQMAKEMEIKGNVLTLPLSKEGRDIFDIQGISYFYGDKGGVVYISDFFFLFEPKDWSSKNRPAGIDDPRLASDEYVKGLIKEAHRFLRAPPPKYPATLEGMNDFLAHKEILRFYLKISGDPEVFKKAKKFLLAHELAHLQKQHVMIAGTAEVIKRRGYLVVLYVLIGLSGLNYLVDDEFNPSFAGSVLTVATIFLTYYLVTKSVQFRMGQNHEYEADAIAAKKYPDLRNEASKFHEALANHFKEIKVKQGEVLGTKSLFYKKINDFLIEWNNWTDKHPDSRLRAKRIRLITETSNP